LQGSLPIQGEEQLRQLYFAVADQSMKVEKEMRNFKRKLSEELAVILGATGTIRVVRLSLLCRRNFFLCVIRSTLLLQKVFYL